MYTYVTNIYICTQDVLSDLERRRLSQRSNPMMKPMRELCANYAHPAPTCLNWNRLFSTYQLKYSMNINEYR